MKKITLLFALFAFMSMGAQITIVQGFNSESLPAGWENEDFYLDDNDPCEGEALYRDNLYISSPSSVITSNNDVAASNGTDVSVSFKWSTTRYSETATVGLSCNVQYSTNNGSTWQTIGTITTSAETSCATFTGTVPAAMVPSGTSFKFRIDAAWVSGDFYFDIDDLSVTQVATAVPACITGFAVDQQDSCGNYPVMITWNSSTGALGYKITIGTTAGGSDVANNIDAGNVTEYVINGPTGGTSYFITVTPYNAVGDNETCTEATFTTSETLCYCDSLPTSFDNDGITNVQIGETDFETTPISYFDHSAIPVELALGVYTNVQISFATAFTYSTVIWIDFNDNFNFDANEIVYTGESTNLNPTTLNASFVMPATATLGTHRMRIVTTDAVQTPSDPCYSGTYGVTLDFSVNIIEGSCTPAAATVEIVTECVNNQYTIEVNVTSLGNGTPTLSDGTTTWPITATGVITAGPYASGSTVNLMLMHGDDETCNLPFGPFTYTCPPANDDCSDAIALTVGTSYANGTVVATNLGATESDETAPGCANYEGGDVWYSVVVPASGNLTFENGTIEQGVTDSAGAVYSGSCGSLVLIECDDSDSDGANDHPLISVTGRTPGEILYYRVWEYNNDVTGAFAVAVYDATLSTNGFTKGSFTYFPNPVKNVLNLSYTQNISNVEVFNMIGQQVIAKGISNNTQVDMSQLSKGAYIIKVTSDNQTQTIKVIKE